MKINVNKFYVVYKPTPESEMADVFNGQANDLKGLQLQFHGELEPEMVYGIYTTKSTAQKDADAIMKVVNAKQKTYGIYTSHGKFLFKEKFNSESQMFDYLDAMKSRGNDYAAFLLTENNKRVTKKQLEVFKKKIDASSLNDTDMDAFIQLYTVLENKTASEGMILANSFDTFQREFIPNSIWVAMGGELN